MLFGGEPFGRIPCGEANQANTPKNEAQPRGTQIFAAVVYRPHSTGWDGLESNRQDGDWACFLGFTQEEATQKAVAAATEWEDMGGKPIGYYGILTGELTAVVKRSVTTETETFESLLTKAGRQ